MSARRLRILAGRLVGPALGLLVLAAAVVLGVTLKDLADRTAENRIITALATGHDVPVSENAGTKVLFARIAFLAHYERPDDAQPLVDLLATREAPALYADALYDLANARLHRAFDHLERGKIDLAAPLVRLARRDYRRALGLVPDYWNARFNYDIASRLIRDFPTFDLGKGDLPPASLRNLWTNLPGQPEGLP